MSIISSIEFARMSLKTNKRPAISRNSRRNTNEDDLASPTISTPVANADIESEIDPLEADVNYKIQLAHSADMRDLNDFFSDTKMINKSADPTTNIVNRQTGKCYNVPDKKIPTMFKFLENCRRSGQRLMFNEKQNETSSGIMLDFDIYQDMEEDQINDEILYVLIQRIMEILLRIVNFKDKKKETFYTGIIRKPKILYNEEKECYKDGFHMIIPSIKVSRGVKKLLISELLEELETVMADVVPAKMPKLTNEASYQRKQFLDTNSAQVVTFFVGSSSKKGSAPYVLTHIYEVTVNFETKNIMIVKNLNLLKSKTFNVCYEFSLNYECPAGVIKKVHYEPADSYILATQELSKLSKPDEEKARNFGEIAMHSIHDAQMEEIKNLLDILAPERYEQYTEWYKVLCALANCSTNYKSLAEYFSRKSKKFNIVDFEKYWGQASKGPVRNRKGISIGSLYHWAKQDNPDRFDEFRKDTAHQILLDMVYEPYKDGILSHADIALVLSKLLPHKYVSDRPKQGKKRVWYEFILDDDHYQDGELYKWREWADEHPIALSMYVSYTMPKLFEKVMAKVKKNYDNSSGDTSKYYKKVLDNFKATIRKLGDKSFKKNVIEQAAERYAVCGFADQLDRDPLIRGVQNGVLKLSDGNSYAQLVQGMHTYKISKFTSVSYVPFNPYDPITKKILITLRSMFPDAESDSFEFTMSFLASTLDGNPKESMIMLMIGKGSNGKSALVELHKSAIGDTYGVKMQTSFLTAKNGSPDSASPAIMQLKDATFAYYSETNKHEILNAARMKEVTGQETLTGRRLHENLVNFKPKCHHLLLSQYPFDILAADHGTWRRLIQLILKIRFVDTNAEKYDPADPFQRIADPDIGDKWSMDPEVQSRYLGFMVWMHYWLQRKYNGKVKAVPHPHIKMETEKYRKDQDVICEFLSQRLVKLPDEKAQLPLVDEIQKYITWYAKNKGNVIQAKGLTDQFQNSDIGKYIKNTKRGLFLEGYRFLDAGETPGDGEEYAKQDVYDIDLAPEVLASIVPESPEQYYERMCKEYDEHKHLMSREPKYDVDLQTASVLDEKEVSNSYLSSINNRFGADVRSDNIEINGRILNNGIILKNREEPGHLYNMSVIDLSEYEDYFSKEPKEEPIIDESDDEKEITATAKKLAELQTAKITKAVTSNISKKAGASKSNVVRKSAASSSNSSHRPNIEPDEEPVETPLDD